MTTTTRATRVVALLLDTACAMVMPAGRAHGSDAVVKAPVGSARQGVATGVHALTHGCVWLCVFCAIRRVGVR